MDRLVVYALIAAVGLVILVLLARWLGGAEKLPYQGRSALLSASEREFFRALVKAVNGRWLIFAKVRIADVLMVPRGTPKWLSWHSRIAQKHADFVLCDLVTTRPLIIIELDDPTHDRPDRQARDQFVDQAYRHAGVPILHAKTARAYSVSSLAQQLTAARASVGQPPALPVPG